MEQFEKEIKRHNLQKAINIDTGFGLPIEKAITEDSNINSEFKAIVKAFSEGLISEEVLEKARSGVYKDNPINRKQGRVGTRYGAAVQGGQTYDLETKKQGPNLSSVTEKYSWGELVKVSKGKSWTAIFHPPDQKKIRGLKEGQSTTIKDEQGMEWKITHNGENYNLQGTGKTSSNYKGNFSLEKELKFTAGFHPSNEKKKEIAGYKVGETVKFNTSEGGKSVIKFGELKKIEELTSGVYRAHVESEFGKKNETRIVSIDSSKIVPREKKK